MDPTEFLQRGTVRISDGVYAVCRTDQSHPTAFATIQDETETTVVVKQDDIDPGDVTHIEAGWERMTFEIHLPFELVGFLATVATALADAEVPVFVLSSYSTDHVFVKEEDFDTAVQRLAQLGCTGTE